MNASMQNNIAEFIAISNNALFLSTLLLFLTLLVFKLHFTFHRLQTIHNKSAKETRELTFKLGFGISQIKQDRYYPVIMLCILLVVSVIPLYHGSTLAQISRGIIGDLSISGLLVQIVIWINYIIRLPVMGSLLCGNNQSSLKEWRRSPILYLVNILPRRFCLIIFILGLILYLAAFSFIPFDLYALGYYPKYLLVVVFILQLIFWQIKRVFAVIWLIALVAFYYKLQTSINLWDYLLDPILWLLCSYAWLFGLKDNKLTKNN